MTFLPDPYSNEMVDKLVVEYDKRGVALEEAKALIKILAEELGSSEEFSDFRIDFKDLKSPWLSDLAREWIEKYDSGFQPVGEKK